MLNHSEYPYLDITNASSEQTVSSLVALPHSIWLSLIVVEFVCAIGLIAPIINKSWGKVVPISAICIAAEMVLFSALHFTSGNESHGNVVYWFVVAAICAFIAYGRYTVKPVGHI